MASDKTFLHSRMARRILWLFVLCALLPITVFAAISIWNVTHQLKEQGQHRLSQMSHEEGMGIAERLGYAEADLKLAAFDIRANPGLGNSQLPASMDSLLKGRFEGLELVTAAGEEQVLFGKLHAKPETDSNAKTHLRSGKTLLSTTPCDQATRCIFLSRSLDGEQANADILVGEIHGGYLWDKEDIPESANLCVQDEAGFTLFCSNENAAGFPTPPANQAPGQWNWKQGNQEYLADCWRLFLKPRYHTAQWTVVASEAMPDMLAPLSAFKRNFALVSLLALWVVLLVSLIQIRRSLVPLRELQEGTQRISAGDFRSRLTFRSGDEFEELASSFNSMAHRIEKQMNSLRTINEIDRAILSASETDQIVNALLERLPTLVSSDLVSLCLLDPQNHAHALTYVKGTDPTTPSAVTTVVLSAEELEGLNTAKELQTLECGDACPHYLAPLIRRGMNSFLVAPIFLNDRICAVIALGHAKAGTWTETDRQQMRQLADQMAVAISNARLVGELRELNIGTLTAFARAIDAKSPWTAGHSERVTQWALKIAVAFGLPKEELDIMRRGGLLHDVGKIGIPAYVLDKPGKLTPEEMTQMREHVSIGGRILEPVPGFADCLHIVWQHHEWLNGSGYPKGLAGEEITFHARIFAVADVYDALTSDRPYRPGMSVEQAVRIIKEGSGTQFDPAVVEKFLGLVEEGPADQQASLALVEAR